VSVATGSPGFAGLAGGGPSRFGEHGNGLRIGGSAWRLRIATVGGSARVRIASFPGDPSELTVIRKPDGCTRASRASCLDEAPLADSEGRLRAAPDLGVEALATLHTESAFANIRAPEHARAKFARERRALARKAVRLAPPAQAGRQGSAAAHLEGHACASRASAQAHLRAGSALRVRRCRGPRGTAVVRSANSTPASPWRRVWQKADPAIRGGGWRELLLLLRCKLQAGSGSLPQFCSRGTGRQRFGIHHRAWAVPVAEAARGPCVSVGTRLREPCAAPRAFSGRAGAWSDLSHERARDG
jgi:hypothetical protein